MNKTLITFFIVLFCLTSSFGWSLTMKDLVHRDGVYYKKFADVPFTGEVDGFGQGMIKNGKEEGPWVYFYDNGELFSQGIYKNGKEEGSWITYYKGGNLSYKGNYKNGKTEGSWIRYWSNGQLLRKGKHKNGKKEGSWVEYNEYGVVLKDLTGTFKNGKKISD